MRGTIVRYDGQIMTGSRYAEVKAQEEAQRKVSIMGRLNLYFFGEEHICLSDWLWFYGMMLGMVAVSGVTFLITKIWV